MYMCQLYGKTIESLCIEGMDLEGECVLRFYPAFLRLLVRIGESWSSDFDVENLPQLQSLAVYIDTSAGTLDRNIGGVRRLLLNKPSKELRSVQLVFSPCPCKVYSDSRQLRELRGLDKILCECGRPDSWWENVHFSFAVCLPPVPEVEHVFYQFRNTFFPALNAKSPLDIVVDHGVHFRTLDSKDEITDSDSGRYLAEHLVLSRKPQPADMSG